MGPLGTTRCASQVGLPRRKRDRDKGPKDRPILWTPKLADPRSPIRANSPSTSYSLRGNVHPGNELSLSRFFFLLRAINRINFQRDNGKTTRGENLIFRRSRRKSKRSRVKRRRRRRIVNPSGCLIEGKVAGPGSLCHRACSTDGRGLIRHRDSA